MAIGDNNNSNLFGTNYNAEEEERKKAELAAQNARMGAGNVPASAFGQAPAVAPFSLEAAGQVNPMMQEQSIPTESVSSLITDNPFIATGGTPTTAQPNVNFNAFSAADQANPAFKDMSAAEILNKFNEPGYTTPPLVEPTFFERPKSRFRGFVDPIIDRKAKGVQDLFSVAKVGYQYFSDPSKPTLQSLTEQEKQNRSAGLADLQARNEESIRRGEAFLSQDATTQAPSGASDLGATPSVTPPVETPSEGAQEQQQSIPQGAPGSAQANFVTRMATGEPLTPQEIQDAQSFAASMGTTFDPATGYSREPFENAQQAQGQVPVAPAGGLTTVGGASLSEFLSGQAMPEQGFTQEESPLGGRGVTLTQDQMNTLSAEREARLDARPDFGEAVSDRDRRAARGDGISMADQTAMAKANARDATPSEVARGNQVANALGVDLKTGQPLQATGGLTETELQRRREFAYKQEQDILAAETKAKETEGERSVNRAKAVGSLQALKADLDLIKETGEEVRTLTLKPRTEGLLAKALATVSPTSTAAQLERASGVLTGDAFIKGMQVIKAFGGGLGSVTEVEGLKVERAQGAIFENGMGDEERRQAVKDYIQVRENAYNRIREAFVKEYGETDAQTYLGTKNANATTEKAVPNDRNVASAADTLLSDPKYN